MNDNSQPSTPATDARPFHDIVASRVSRRTMLLGGMATAAVTYFSAPGTAGARSGPTAHLDRALSGALDSMVPQRDRLAASPAIGFTSIPLDKGPVPTIAPEYQMSVILPWRAKLDGSGDSFEYEGFTSADQEASVGIGHDGMWYFGDDSRGMLAINNEFGGNTHVFGAEMPADEEQVKLSQAAHGVTIVEIERGADGWAMVPGSKNRRIHVNTPVSFSGPAAGSELLATPAGSDPTGTLNNCANGYTPWGTYLTCEENFNGYFGATGDFESTPALDRYGFSAEGFGYGWERFDPRFDLANPDAANEWNRFGWVVEIDPEDPASTPVKRTALGRVKHEGATFAEGRGGHAVVYMGDDERFDYIYRFVSARPWQAMIDEGISPLDEGTLAVARFADDGTGEWLPLTPDAAELADWTIDRILVETRLAADAVGATPMDRPEWIAVGVSEEVFCALTNNSDRTEADAANPQAPNEWGHIIRWVDADQHTGATFRWDMFAIASDVIDDAGQMFGSPDGIWADADGRIFVQTDGAQPGENNDQMLVADPSTGAFKRLFTGVVGAEVTGITTTPDRTTMFINVQHPGDGDPTLTNFPEEFTGASGPIPRDATVVITRVDGGVIGS